MPGLTDWTTNWNLLDVEAPPEAELDRLIAAYSEPARAYHNLRHLDECFAQLADVRNRLDNPGAVGLAIWWHDVIYDARRSDNEDRSAAWAEGVLTRAGSGPAVVELVRHLILSTAHQRPPEPGDAAFLTDIDLAILGAPAERFDEYEGQIRAEYAWVSEPAFRAGRLQVLDHFLARPTIFATEVFRDRLERSARRNLARSIGRLRSGR